MQRSLFCPGFVVVAVFLAVLLSGCGSGERGESHAALEAGLDSLLHEYVDANEDIHSAVLLVEGPDFKWVGAVGYANPSSNLPIRTDDQFYLASTAKMMTATMVMKLVEAGKVGLEDPITDYLPASLIKGLHVHGGRDYGSTITIRQLLSHTSGIADNWADDNFIGLIAGDPGRMWEPEETLDYVKEHQPAHFPPGEGWKYSDINYNVLGLMIEKVTGQSLEAAFRDSLFEPLGMQHTHRHFLEDERPVGSGRPASQWFREDLVCNELVSLSADWAGGGLYATADDLNRYLHAFVDDQIFAQSSTRTEMLRWTEAMQGVDYGLGVLRFRFADMNEEDTSAADLGEVWGHQGASSAFMYYWPERQVYLIGTLNQMRREGELLEDAMRVVEATME
jgi:CubicO group peptidase (beta-lactamase class C family)